MLATMAIGGPEDADLAALDLAEFGTEDDIAANILNNLDCSFDATTPVLMAGGTAKAITAIKPGDRVKATDPQADRTADEAVTDVHDTVDVDLADLTVTAAGGQRSILHTTQNHPFWDVTTAKWTTVDHLRVGDRLRSTGPTVVRVASVRKFTHRQHMYNLTVAEIHTFYVLADGTAVLVHNVCHNMRATLVGADGKLVGTGSYQSGNMTALQKALGFPKGMVAIHTEAQVATGTAFREGDTLYLEGELPPCTSCKGYMNRAAEYWGIDVIYTWGPKKIWTATG